jgi:hypothetical protein
LIDDRNLQEMVGNAGAAYVAVNHNWLSIAKQLVEIYRQTIDLKQQEVKR